MYPKTRRSIRKFTEQPVTEDEVRQVVPAAAFAPSWKRPQIALAIICRTPTRKRRTSWRRLHCWTSPSTRDRPHGAIGTGRADRDQGSLGLRAPAHQHRLPLTGSRFLTRALPRADLSALPRTRSVSARSSWAFTIPRRGLPSVETPRVRSGRAHRHLVIRAQDLGSGVRDIDTLLRFESAYFEHRGSNSFFSRHKVTRAANRLPSAAGFAPSGLAFSAGSGVR